MRSRRAMSAARAALLAAGLAFIWTCNHVSIARADDEAREHARALSKAFRTAAEQTLPTVVTVQANLGTSTLTRGRRPGSSEENPFRGSPLQDMIPEQLREFLERGGNERLFQMPPRESMGSGVIIDPSGIVLTNNHVVAGAEEVVIHLSDGREFRSKDIKTDPRTDLAVVRISGAGTLPAARLGDSDQMQIGDWVIAVGSPFGLDMTVSAGIISNTGRVLSDIRSRTKFLQTDAAINPGNSGGPLVSLDGEIIGINTAIASNSGSYQGVGFAIPINVAKWVSDQLIQRGSVQRAYLGVIIQEVSQGLAEQLNVKQGEGIVVSQVFPDSPAAVAGIVPGDVILRFAGTPVSSLTELQGLVERAPLDSSQPLEVLHDGKAQTTQVVLKAMPDEKALAGVVREKSDDPSESQVVEYGDDSLGLKVTDLTAALAQELEIDPKSKGVVIREVDPQSLAYEAGLRPGMVIVKVKQREVQNVAEFREALSKADLSQGVLLLVRDGEYNHFLVLRKSNE